MDVLSGLGLWNPGMGGFLFLSLLFSIAKMPFLALHSSSALGLLREQGVSGLVMLTWVQWLSRGPHTQVPDPARQRSVLWVPQLWY